MKQGPGRLDGGIWKGWEPKACLGATLLASKVVWTVEQGSGEGKGLGEKSKGSSGRASADTASSNRRQGSV